MTITRTLTMAAISAGMLIGTVPAAGAQALVSGAGLRAPAVLVQEVGYRRHYRGHRYGFRRGRGGYGGALMAGAIIGTVGIIAAERGRRRAYYYDGGYGGYGAPYGYGGPVYYGAPGGYYGSPYGYGGYGGYGGTHGDRPSRYFTEYYGLPGKLDPSR